MLSVFIGGGKASNGISATTNGSITLDLSQSTVDGQSLGLSGVQASGAASTDIGTGSATSVQNILANATNAASISNNTTTFDFTGPGFSDTSGSNTIKVAVNLTGVTNSATLVSAVNQAIANAGNGASQQATAFKNANIAAAINTDTSGKQQLTFNSSATAFQVQGGDQVATALLGSFSSGSTGTVANVAAQAAAAYSNTLAATEHVNFRIVGAGLTGAQGEFTLAIATTDTVTNAVANINTAIAANASLAATGIQAANSGGTIKFTGHAGQSFQVQTAGDVANTLGFGTYVNDQGTAGGTGNFDYSSLTGPNAVVASKTQGVQVSINGGATIDLGTLTGGTTELAQINSLNAAFQGNAALRAAGLSATDNAGKVKISSSTGANFRLNFYGGTGDAFGFGASPAAGLSSAGYVASAYTAKDSVNSTGAQESQNASNKDVYQFTGLTNTGDAQTVTLTAVDGSGSEHTLNVNLTTSNASTLDQALSTINNAILQSNDSTLKQIGAFKEAGTSGNVNGVEGVRFLSTGNFRVSLGASPASSTAGVSAGVADGATGTSGGAVLSSVSNGAGSTADISNITTASAAVAALAVSVTKLGQAQAVVGRGENQFNYAINLAQSQLTNLSAAEARIRDADLAAESANLTKSQIQLQAGIAALAQANSAPQQVLKLLQ
ncbi:MAG TPA: flagellin [Bryobacteraceae bacterium]|nr:flagellin [Bryobacteraceae bacterium]